MPPQNLPNQSPEVVPTPVQGEAPSAPNLEQGVETAPQPISKELPRTETFSDQPITQPVIPDDPISVPESLEVEPTEELEAEEQKEADGDGDIGITWVSAVDTIIDKDKDKPYEEEEDSEKLNINYQQKALGKKIEKDEE